MLKELQGILNRSIVDKNQLSDLVKYNNTMKQSLYDSQKAILMKQGFTRSKYLQNIPTDLESKEINSPIDAVLEPNDRLNNIYEQIDSTFQDKVADYEENPKLKQMFYEAVSSNHHKRHFQVIYIFKNKTKRMYRIDCMTRKINV
jgi:hypothetical protein